MKIMIRFLLSVALITAFGILVQAQPSKSKKIFVAVLDFDARSGIDQGEAASLSDIFSSQLAQTGKYIMVERNGIKKILTEQGFQQSEACSSVECLAEVGKILKVEKIFSGTIGKIGKLYTINIQLINVSTAQIELNRSRQHEGDIEDLATSIVPEIAAEMTKTLTGEDVEVNDSGSSSSSYKRHEFSLGFGGGPRGKWSLFKAPIEDVRVSPKNVISIAYNYNFSPYFGLGLRFTSFRQTNNYSLTLNRTFTATSVLNCNLLCVEGKLNFIRGVIEPYGTLSFGYTFGNIHWEGTSTGSFSNILNQQDFDGPALAFGLGSKIHITNHFGLALDLRAVGISVGWRNNQNPTGSIYNGDKFDGSYSAAFFILFYQF